MENNNEARLKRAAEDDWGVADSKTWKAEENLKFSANWYYAHLYLIVYMVIGFGILMFQIATGSVYRVLTIVTWPWLLSSSKLVYLMSILVYSGALYIITSQVVKQLRNFPLNAGNIAYFFLYYLGLLMLIARFILLLVSPAQLEMPYFEEHV